MSPMVTLATATIRLYQLTLSSVMAPSCRFHPTCSAYAITALKRHGALRGGWLTVRRLARCQPFGGMGEDPVPQPTFRPSVMTDHT